MSKRPSLASALKPSEWIIALNAGAPNTSNDDFVRNPLPEQIAERMSGPRGLSGLSRQFTADVTKLVGTELLLA